VDAWLQLARDLGQAWTHAAADLLGVAGLAVAPQLAPTPRDEIALEGGAKLYRFDPDCAPLFGGAARSGTAGRFVARDATASRGMPLLLVPSLINRWYVLDLRRGASVVEALVGAGFDVWCLDWGVPEAEDRYLDWEAVNARLGRAVRRVRRETKASRLAMLGYCMGGTLTAIYAAQHADELAALVTLAAPIDFARGGMLRRMVDPQWFDGDAIADAGNVAPAQMQAGFTALRPTLDLGKAMSMPELASDPAARAAFLALDAWASDNIPFPGGAYRRYIGELYQRNQLIEGGHRVGGRPVELANISCPTLAIVASRDTICPRDAATALLDRVSTKDTAVLEVHGGHVGACVGSRAVRDMYPALVRWLAPRLTAQ
jgi:polyhydroxyalkanoate synthase